MELFKNIEQFKEYYGGITNNLFWGTVGPIAKTATYTFFEDWLDRDLLNRLSAFVPVDSTKTWEGSPSVKEKELIELLRFSLVGYTDFIGSFRFARNFSSSGKAVATPSNHQAPGKWQTVGERRDAIQQGDNFLEKALKFLEQNKADFPEWKISESVDDLLIKNADSLTKYFAHCGGSRRMFMKLLPYLRNHQENLGRYMGEAMAEQIDVIAKKSSPSSVEKKLLAKVCKVIAINAVFDSLTYLNINDEWRIVSVKDGIQNEDAITEEKREKIRLNLMEEQGKAVDALKDFLQEVSSETVFPEYFNSKYYVQPEVVRSSKRMTNDPDKKYVVL